MGEGVTVDVGVNVRVGVAVGGTIICVTKLHDNKDKTKSPKKIRFIFIDSNPLHVPVNLILVLDREQAHINFSYGSCHIETRAHLPEADVHVD